MGVTFQIAPLNMAKKHPCPDCRFCQHCSDARCSSCRAESDPVRKLSFSEQIALFETNNRDADARPDLPIRITGQD